MATTFGKFLVNEALPKDLQVSGPMNKKDLYKRIYTMAQRDPTDAAKRIDALRFLGHSLATTEGLSVGLDDITPDPKRKNILDPLMARIKKTSDPDVRRSIILDAEHKMLDLTNRHPGSMGQMLRSGSRGNTIQLMRTTNAQIQSLDPATQQPIPWLIPRGYSEGLRPSEHWVSNTETRTNLINARVAVTEPGAISKVLVNNMNDQLILSEDCGTHNGIMMNTDDGNLIDRILARSEAGFSRNTVITPHTATRLRANAKQVMVRSPMTCEMNGGICQKCFGKNEFGQYHNLGTNVGVRAAQAISEPVTQMQISARHGVRGETSDVKKVEGMEALKQMLNIPKSFLYKATLASTAGTVDSISKAPQGGHNIYVGATKHYVPPSLKPVVSVGNTVTPGDVLSDGVPKPDEVVQYKGLGAGRKYMVDRLHGIYKDSVMDVDKRHLEVLARSHLNYVRIEDDPGERFIPGEVVNYTTLLKSLADDVEDVPVGSAKGQMLASGAMHHTAGTIVTSEMQKELKANKVKNVTVSTDPPKISFLLRPLVRNPLLNSDWMARLGHQYLKDSILEGVQYGEKSDIHGTHPVPAYAYGKEFGTGKGGRY